MLTATASHSASSTSLSLLQRVRLADAEAWRRMVQVYGPLVDRWCRRWSLQDADAADVFQDVFRAVTEGIARFERDAERGGFRAWLWTITRHKLADHFRRQSREPRGGGGSDAQRRMAELPAVPDDSPDDPAATAGVVHRALDLIRIEFEDRTWVAFSELALHGRSVADVAEELGISLHATYKAKSRVLCRLRQELDGLL